MTSSNVSEVIALEGTGDRRAPQVLKFRTNFKPKKKLKHYPYFSDHSIVPRVKQYLEDNRDKVYVNIDEIVTELQRKYRDYGKKKRSSFRGLVQKAYDVVSNSYSISDNEVARGNDESESSSLTDMEVDSEEVDLIEEPNPRNQQVVDPYNILYMKKLAAVKTGSVTEGGKELIDISSDDENEEEVPAKRSKNADTTKYNDPKPVSNKNTLPEKSSSNGQAAPEEVGAPIEHVTTNSSNSGPPSTPAVATAGPERRRKRPGIDGAKGPSALVNGDGPRKRRREVPVIEPCCSFKDVGGCSAVLEDVCKLLVHIRHPEVFEQLGVSPPRGFLLHGPPGCGKSLLANAIAGEIGVPLLKVAAPELVAGVSGESEERIRDLFDQAASLAPCVLFLDEIDAITPNRNNAQREMERRIVAQLLTCLDELGEKEGGNQVLVVGATNRPDSIDPALRRAGRFDREVCMGIPDLESRAHILRVVCGRLALTDDVSSDSGIKELASLTPGFVGADLAALTREAAMVAVNRIFAEMQNSVAKPENASEVEVKIESMKRDNDTQEQTEKDSTMVIKSNVTSTEEVVPTNGQQTTITVKDQNAAPTEIPSDNEPKTCEVVNLEDGDSLSGAPSQTNCEVSEEEMKGVECPPTEEVITQEVPEAVSVNENENLKGIHDQPSSVQDTEVTQDIEVTQDVEGTQGKEGTQVIEGTQCIEGTQVGATACNQEQEESKETKNDDDVQVLEVEMVNCSDKPSGETESTAQGAENGSPAALEENQINIGKTDLVLTQKLNPLSTWSPALCQLMSWLKDTPPLSTTQLSNLTITMADFHEALHHVQPSSKREGFVTVPDVTWEDIGSLSNVRAELQLSVLAPVRYAKQFSELGLTAPTGVLLCGPPGCGKTLLAKAVANEAGINFISVKGPELLNMYVGESERAVRQVFQRARNSAPCVIFFDELDALCPKRSDSGDNGVSSRVVNQLLTEMDGVEGRAAVFLMAASNRPDIIDPAVLRPGRLDKIVYVGLPNAEDRKDILRALTKNGTRPQLSADVDLLKLANIPQLEGFSGADLAALVREAGVQALREFITNGGDSQSSTLSVSLRHFNSASGKIRPSVTAKDRKHYEKLQELYASTTISEKPETMDTS